MHRPMHGMHRTMHVRRRASIHAGLHRTMRLTWSASNDALGASYDARTQNRNLAVSLIGYKNQSWDWLLDIQFRFLSLPHALILPSSCSSRIGREAVGSSLAKRFESRFCVQARVQLVRGHVLRASIDYARLFAHQKVCKPIS